MAFASWLACRLPEAPLVAGAELAGELWYRLAPDRAARARRNLRRVVTSLAETGSASAAVKRAADDPAALESLVRRSFRHAARYYLEVARIGAFSADTLDRRLVVETPAAVEEAFGRDGPIIFVGLHFGSLELPALFLARWTHKTTTAPMETIGDPPLQRWFERSRGSVGIRIVDVAEARRELIAALRRGDPAGLVADRDLTGGGIAIPFFGAPAPLPAGPALVAMETGARVYVASVRRGAVGAYHGRLERVDLPADGTRRERVEGFLLEEARAFERAIAAAPEQWWGAFFPIWPDLEGKSSRREGPLGHPDGRAAAP